MDLTLEVVFSLIRSTDPFPIDFDDAWQWIGYSEKGKAKRALLNAGFVEDVDFLPILAKSSGGRPAEKIYLSVECLKMFCMMAGTAKGKEVRLYFLRCEAELKRRIQEEGHSRRRKIVQAIVQEDASSWTKRFEDDFFEEAYRVTGWKKPKKGHSPCIARFVNDNIYKYFPSGVPERLNEVNPRNSNGSRKRKHHQYLTENWGLPLLASQQATVMAVLRLSPSSNLERFKRNMAKACGQFLQGELPGLEDWGEAS